MLKINDKVCYAHNYLHSIQAPKEIADLRGVVVEIGRELKRGLFYVKVQWDDDTEFSHGALSKNLAPIRKGELIDKE